MVPVQGQSGACGLQYMRPQSQLIYNELPNLDLTCSQQLKRDQDNQMVTGLT